MASNVSRKPKGKSSPNSPEISSNDLEQEPGKSFYSASELNLIRRQLRAGNAVMRDAARGRGYRLHPKLAKKKPSPK